MMLSVKTIADEKLKLSPPFQLKDDLFHCDKGDLSLKKLLENLDKQDTLSKRFLPHIHGFRFSNDMKTIEYVMDFPVNITLKTGGRCGGFVYASLDYFLANRDVPDQKNIPDSCRWLDTYIFDRLMKSLQGIADEVVGILLNPDPNKIQKMRNDCKPGGNTYNDLRNRLKNEPCPLVLVAPGHWQVGDWHQVLAVGCTHSAFAEEALIHIYNNNNPGVECVLKVEGNIIAEYELDCHGECDMGSMEEWSGYFINDDYVHVDPPQDSYPKVDLSGQDCRRGNWSPDPARYNNYNESYLVNTNFTDNDQLNAIDFYLSEARNAKFIHVIAIKSNFSCCDLSGANFDNSDLKASNFKESKGNGATTFRNTKLHDANFTHFIGPNSNFSGSQLNNTLFEECDLSDSIFDHADLSEVNFSNSYLVNARFENEAKIGDCDFNGANLVDTSFKYASIRNTNFNDVGESNRVDFSETTLNTIVMMNSTIQNSKFFHASIMSLVFIQSTIDKANFRTASLKDCVFNNCSLNQLDFTNATLSNVNFGDMTMQEFISCTWTNVSCNGVTASRSDVQRKINNL